MVVEWLFSYVRDILAWLWLGRFESMELIMKKSMIQGLCGLLGLMFFGCSSADNEMAGGNIQAVNHTLSAINWLSVNGYWADGGGGAPAALSCRLNGVLA